MIAGRDSWIRQPERTEEEQEQEEAALIAAVRRGVEQRVRAWAHINGYRILTGWPYAENGFSWDEDWDAYGTLGVCLEEIDGPGHVNLRVEPEFFTCPKCWLRNMQTLMIAFEYTVTVCQDDNFVDGTVIAQWREAAEYSCPHDRTYGAEDEL